MESVPDAIKLKPSQKAQNHATQLPLKTASRTTNIEAKASGPTEEMVSCEQVAKLGWNENQSVLQSNTTVATQ